MIEEAIFSFILERVAELVTNEVQFLCGVGNQAKKLQRQLNRMHWFLRDTSKVGQSGQKAVLEWVLDIRNLAYEAENVVENYALASRRRRGITSKIKRFAGILNECYQWHQIGSDIETLINKITELETSFNDYGIRNILENRDDNGTNNKQWRKTYSFVDDEKDLFVGSGDAIKILAENLVGDRFRTVSIHGMGGLGKTTLAKKVFHHEVVRKHFNQFCWVSISQEWQKDYILQGILIKLLPGKRDEISKWRDEELVGGLHRFMVKEKCLIVLDDIWAIDAWMAIERAIAIREKGSKVMSTTRNEQVAEFLDRHGFNYNPQLLTVDESWELLCNKALRGQDSQEIMKLEPIGKEMIKKCGGLPLAVMALGGILSSRDSYDEWQNVLDNIDSYLMDDSDGLIKLNEILTMSYDDLPFHLKPCFLYLSKYAEDEEIEVETLYQYWMAEGMVSHKYGAPDNKTMMDVAEHYLRVLVERSLVLVEKEEGISLRRFKSCRLHDLIRDVCISKAKEEKFFESIDYRYIGDASEASTRTTSRLSIYLPNEAKIYVPPAKAVSRSLRSFILVKEYVRLLDDINRGSLTIRWDEFLMLRVLSLELVESNDFYGENSIGKLVHLRYLGLKNCVFDDGESSSIGNLKQLQTLDLSNSVLTSRMLKSIHKLSELIHLYLPDIHDRSNSGKLRLDGLHKLEILKGFYNKYFNVNHLSTLINLRKLHISLDGNLEDMENLMKHVRNLTHLRILQLHIDVRDLSSEKVLPIINNMLSYSYLVHLTIDGKLSEWPRYDWSSCFKLQTLLLYGSVIEEDPFSALGRLPELRSLSIIRDAFAGKEMSCPASDFPQLRELRLSYLNNLERLKIEAGGMPNLSKLQIESCPRLKTIPSGLKFITSLKTFEATYMSSEFKESFKVDSLNELQHIQTIRCSIRP